MDFSWELGSDGFHPVDFVPLVSNFSSNPAAASRPTLQQLITDSSNNSFDNSTWNYNDTNHHDKPWSTLRQPVYAVALLAAAYAVVAVLGCLDNAVVIVVICREVKLRTTTNFFLANLAVADILVCIFVLPITLLDNIFNEWQYGEAVCKAAPYLQGVVVGASVNTLAVVAVERYLAIFSTKSSPRMSHRAALLVVLAIWLLPSAMFVPWILVYRQKVFPFHGFDYVSCHADWNDPHTGRAFTIAVVFLTCYFIPLTFIAVFCVLIGIKVWRRRVRGLLGGSRTKQNILAAKTTVLKILVAVVVLFALSWLPLYAIELRNLFGPEMSLERKTTIKRYLSPVAKWLGAANSCVNPFVYCYYSSNFRMGVRSLLGRRAVGADDRHGTGSPFETR